MRSSCSSISGVTSGKSSISTTWRISISESSSMGFGQRLTHSIASSFDFTCQSQKPATSSFVSANGPSMTVRWAPENLTRAPLDDACRPSPASITPAFASSSLNLPMSARSFGLGITPASDSFVALTITINRIGFLLLYSHVERGGRGSTRASWVVSGLLPALEHRLHPLHLLRVRLRLPGSEEELMARGVGDPEVARVPGRVDRPGDGRRADRGDRPSTTGELIDLVGAEAERQGCWRRGRAGPGARNEQDVLIFVPPQVHQRRLAANRRPGEHRAEAEGVAVPLGDRRDVHDGQRREHRHGVDLEAIELAEGWGLAVVRHINLRR